MLYWSAAFFLIALIAGFLGFGGLENRAVGVSQVLFFLFIVLFLMSALISLFRRGSR